MKGKKRRGQTDTFLTGRQKEGVEEEEAGSQESASARYWVGGRGGGGERGGGAKRKAVVDFSHYCICPLCLLGCFCVCV